MSLYGKRIEDLHCFGKVYRVDQIVDGIVPIIMTEHDQRLVNAGRLGQTDNQLAQILQAIVALNGHYHSGIGNRTKDIFGAKYLGFFPLLVPSKREKNILFLLS